MVHFSNFLVYNRFESSQACIHLSSSTFLAIQCQLSFQNANRLSIFTDLIQLACNVAATSLQQQAEQVTVEVDKASRNARRLYAAVSIDAPLSQVWQALTDYEGLGNFIPGT